jgi:hypothetical protein
LTGFGIHLHKKKVRREQTKPEALSEFYHLCMEIWNCAQKLPHAFCHSLRGFMIASINSQLILLDERLGSGGEERNEKVLQIWFHVKTF